MVASQAKRKRDTESPLTRQDGTQQPNASSLSRGEEISFPRGGSSALSPLELKQVANEAANDVLFGSEQVLASHERPAKKKKKVSKVISDSHSDTTAEEKEDKTDLIEHLSMRNLAVGTLLLGQVYKILKHELVISLPDGLHGYVSMADISDQMSSILTQIDESMESDEEDSADESSDEEENVKSVKELPDLNKFFRVGQWLRCVVQENTVSETKRNKKIQLSIEPSSVNLFEDEDLQKNCSVQCSVKSIEDHGAILDLGIKNITGFVSKKAVTNFESLLPGAVFLGNIVKRSDRSVSINEDFVGKNNYISKISSIDSILPGQFIECLVQAVTNHGIIGKAFGIMTVFLPLPHARCFSIEEMKHQYAIGSNIGARILAVTTTKQGNRCGLLSTQPHLLSLSPILSENDALESFPVGYTFDSCVYKGRDGQFLYAAVNDETYGQIHISKLGEEVPSGSFKARVTGYNNVDKLYTMTSDPKLLEVKFLRAVDIPAGELLTNCEISSVSEKGIECKIFNGQFKAFVPPLHISDTRLVYPERKFKIGSKVKGRVLNVDELGRITVTLKKSIVNVDEDEIRIVRSFAELSEVFEKGSKVIGTVEIFKPNGCVLSFFSNIKAFVPNKEISETFVRKPQEHLKLGQTVQVKILDFEPSRNRVIASCKISSESAIKQKNAIDSYIVGRSIIDTVVIEKTKDSVVVESKESGLRGVIFVGHLSDLRVEQNRATLKKMKIGSELRGLVIDKDSRTHVFNLSCKKSLITDAENNNLPLCYEDVKKAGTNTPMHGYVKSISERGVFVGFNGKFVGLVLPSYAAESRDVDICKKYYINQSITVYLLRTDDENERFLLSILSPKKATPTSSTAAINPVDASITDLTQYSVGKVTKAMISSIKKNQLNVVLADNLHGRISVSQVFEKFEDIQDKTAPLSTFKKNDVIDVKVIGSHDIKTRKFLPISHTSSKSHLLELTAKPSEISGPVETKGIEDFKSKEVVVGYINNYSNDIAWLTVTPSVKAKLPVFEISDDGSDFNYSIEDKYPIGTAMKVVVTSVDSKHDFLVVSARSHAISDISEIKVGDTLPARILSVQDTYLLLSLGNDVTGVSFVTDAMDDYSKSLKEQYSQKIKSIVSAKVLEVDAKEKKIFLSLRSEDATSPIMNSAKELKRGDLIRGFIKTITDKGLFISLSRNLQAFVPVSKLTDAYIKEWKKYYKRGQCVIGKVVNCDNDARILLTMRESEVNGELNILKSFSDISVGDIFEGSVRNVTDFGVFVKLDSTANITGLAHKTEVADSKIEDLTALFGEGDRVKAIVLKVNDEKKQLSLGLKASYFTGANNKTQPNTEPEAKTTPDDKISSNPLDEQSDDEVMEGIDYEGSDSEPVQESQLTNIPMVSDGLSLSANFDWTTSILDQVNHSEESSEDDEDFTKLKKHKKKKNARVEDKTLDINTRIPESVGDFERLLVGDPNSSVVWMNYMAFHLQLSEIDKAREIVNRALNTITFREEGEKLNIWIASLNLENTFGTEETLEDVFKRACQYMDSFLIHSKLISIYQMSEKYDKARELFKITAKKFGSEKVSVWVSWGEFLLEQNDADEAHAILANALKALPKRNHVEVVKKFAQLEFSKGDPEQGRSLFEGLLADAPKRIDLWNVYIDQEIKASQKTKVEDIFERVITKKITRKQAKFFFNKWLQFEEAQGDQKTVEYVKAKAAEYVEKNQPAEAT